MTLFFPLARRFSVLSKIMVYMPICGGLLTVLLLVLFENDCDKEIYGVSGATS
jgi:hypothetical protein